MEERKSRSQVVTILRALSRNRMTVLGLVTLITLLFTGIFAHVIALYDFAKQNLTDAFQHLSPSHIFGTDEFGRNIFSRVVHGARMPLLVGFVSVGIAITIGGVLGVVAGYYGRRVDNLIMRFMDVLLAMPQTLLAIAIITVLGTGLMNLMITVGISSVPTYARIVGASVLTIREEEYIETVRTSGTSSTKIIIKHILPNCVVPVTVQVTLGIAGAILVTAGMSFIGLGIQPPNPEWGNIFSSGRDYIRGYAYVTMFPGLAIVITVLSLNLLGDNLRDALDSKLRNQ